MAFLCESLTYRITDFLSVLLGDRFEGFEVLPVEPWTDYSFQTGVRLLRPMI
jgi:hypothetical protein